MARKETRVVVVTGASAGIGLATAARFAKAGFRVFGTSRREAKPAAPGVEMVVCDVTDQASVDRMLASVLERTGRIDVVVNNAGLALMGGADESSLDQVQALFNVNLFGAMRVINSVLPQMRAQKYGRIINVSSVMGFAPAPFSAHYAATKHALEGYSESLDHELRELNIRVSLVEPAYTKTDIESNSIEPDLKQPSRDTARRELSTLFKTMVAAGDDPAIVAQVILKAATDARPRCRYPAGKQAKQISLLRRFVPANAFDKALRNQLGLDN